MHTHIHTYTHTRTTRTYAHACMHACMHTRYVRSAEGADLLARAIETLSPIGVQLELGAGRPACGIPSTGQSSQSSQSRQDKTRQDETVKSRQVTSRQVTSRHTRHVKSSQSSQSREVMKASVRHLLRMSLCQGRTLHPHTHMHTCIQVSSPRSQAASILPRRTRSTTAGGTTCSCALDPTCCGRSSQSSQELNSPPLDHLTLDLTA